MRTVNIVAPHSDQRQLEALPICVDHHLRRRLARRVWIRRGKQARLAQIRRIHRHIPIHLVGRDVYEPRDAMLSCRFQQHMRTVNVRIRELVRVAETEVDVRLCGEVEDGVDLVFAKHPLHLGRRSDVSLLESEVCTAFEDAGVV